MSNAQLTHVLNPETNRYVKVGSRAYERLVKSGDILPQFTKSEPLDEENEEVEIEPITIPVSQPVKIPIVKKRVARNKKVLNKKKSQPVVKTREKLIQNVIPQILPQARNINEDLSDEQVDRLLKKMLYNKLCVDESHKIKKKKRKPKSKRKKRYYSSSSESESESE